MRDKLNAGPVFKELQKREAVPVDASSFCPNCGTQMLESGCKLKCPTCGFFLSCSDFY